MSGRIPQAFIDEIISRADIVEVVGRRVTLKRAGANFKGLCPFHDEKTPSFTVAPQKGFYHCFGCGASGNAIGFLMDFESLSFPEAVEALADVLGLPMPAQSEDGARSESEELIALLGEADQVFRQELRTHRAAIDYLKRRGIDGATAGMFAIGYAPDRWDTVLGALGTSESRKQKLLRAGLLRKNDEGRYYDYFRGRIMFPIRDARGRVIGFGGRVIGDGEPKYLNSPETPVFLKGHALYGVYEARQIKPRRDEVLVVEGYIDVVSLAQRGIGPALATLGTATTEEHVRRLTRIAERVVFCFDGDTAGRKAAWRALETALPFGGGNIELKFLLLPEGEDPDSLLQKSGAEAFAARLEEALPLSRFLLEELQRQNDLSSADGRARLFTTARPLLGSLPAGVYRDLLIQELATLLEMPAERVALALETPKQAAARRGGATPKRNQPPSLIQQAITLLLHYPRIAAKIAPVDGLDELDLPGASALRELLEIARGSPEITTARLIEHFREDPEGRFFQRLVAREPLDDEGGAAAVLGDCLARIVGDARRRQAAEAVKHWRDRADN